MALRVERVLTDVADGLRACLQAELDRQRSDVCAILLQPGQTLTADFCGCEGENACGQATVRLLEAYPSMNFPAADIGGSPCASPLAATFEVAILRCQRTGTDTGPPTAADQTGDALTQLRDLAIIHCAIAGCDAVTSRPHRLGRYVPVSSGGCGGGAWPVTVQLVR